MRVLHVFKTYLPDTFGGIERVIFEIAEGTQSHGVKTEVLTVSADTSHGAVRVGRHFVYTAKRTFAVASTPISAALFGRFRELMRTADLVHYHFPWPTMDLLELTNGSAKPRLVTYHSDIVRQRMLGTLYRPLMHRFLNRMDAIVATSPAYAASSDVLCAYQNEVLSIPIGIDDTAGANPGRVAQWRSKVGSEFFLFVGVLRYYKGLTFLIEAARITGLPVVVVGEGEMRGVIEAANLSNVKLLGVVSEDDKLALLELCRAFVFPSHLRSEAFGVALLEAARAIRPMISCEIGTGTSYVNRHEETGLVIKPADSLGLADAMRRLSENEKEAIQFGRNARLRYEHLFTAKAMADGYFKLYQRLLQGRRGPVLR